MNNPPTDQPFALTLPAELIDALAAAVSERVLAGLRAPSTADAWPAWMAIETAARYLDVSPQRLRKLVAHRQIPYHQEDKGCRILFNRQDLDHWMAGYRIPTRTEQPQ